MAEESASSSAIMRSMPVRGTEDDAHGLHAQEFPAPFADAGFPSGISDRAVRMRCGRAGTSCVVTTGFTARRFSSSFCCRLRSRSSCQSLKRSRSASTKAKRVGAQTSIAENENAVVR